MVILDSKKYDSASKPSLVEISHWYKAEVTNIDEIDLLIERESIQIEDIIMRNGFPKILLSENISEID